MSNLTTIAGADTATLIRSFDAFGAAEVEVTLVYIASVPDRLGNPETAEQGCAAEFVDLELCIGGRVLGFDYLEALYEEDELDALLREMMDSAEEDARDRRRERHHDSTLD